MNDERDRELAAIEREATILRSFIDDFIEVGGEERIGPYSNQAKYQNVRVRATKLVKLVKALRQA